MVVMGLLRMDESRVSRRRQLGVFQMVDSSVPSYEERLSYGTDQGRWLFQQLKRQQPNNSTRRTTRRNRAYHQIHADAPTPDSPTETPAADQRALRRSHAQQQQTVGANFVDILILLFSLGGATLLLLIVVLKTGVEDLRTMLFEEMMGKSTMDTYLVM